MWKELLVLLMGLTGLLFGAYKWGVARSDKRLSEWRDAHGERLDRHDQQLAKMEELIHLTRDELHQNYLRAERIERMENAIDGKLESVHIRLTAIARDLNRVIGHIESREKQRIADD